MSNKKHNMKNQIDMFRYIDSVIRMSLLFHKIYFYIWQGEEAVWFFQRYDLLLGILSFFVYLFVLTLSGSTDLKNTKRFLVVGFQ